jgi:hypothetical protein
MRLTLEMRIMSGSDIIIALQCGNEWGTASIKVLTIPNTVPNGDWTAFCHRVANKWMSYENAGSMPLNVPPHWAKE